MFAMYTNILLTSTVSLLILVSLRSFHLSKRVAGLKKHLSDSDAALAAASQRIEELQLEEKRLKSFGCDLQEAEIANTMQKGRTIHQISSDNLNIPERYQYVHSLARKGITAEDIAAILTISPQEADQLVTLANLTNK